MIDQGCSAERWPGYFDDLAVKMRIRSNEMKGFFGIQTEESAGFKLRGSTVPNLEYGQWIAVDADDIRAIVIPLPLAMDYDHVAGMISEDC